MAKPIKTWKEGGIDVSAWALERGGYSFKISKRFKSKDGTYKESAYWFKNELVKLQAFIADAIAWGGAEDVAPELVKPPANIKDSINDDDIPF